MLLSRDSTAQKPQFFLLLLVGLLALGLRSYGFCVALIAGTVLYYLTSAFPRLRGGEDKTQPSEKGNGNA